MDKDPFEITFTGNAYPGQAFGRDSTGRMVFVPFGLAGEKVRVQIESGHKRWAQGRILEILQPSPDRIVPRCAHYHACGGCHYQHIPYSVQLEIKADIVSSQLKRLAGIEDPPVGLSIPSPAHWNYRNNMQFSLSEDCQLGFHALNSEFVVPIKECHLPEVSLADLWPRIELSENPGIDRITLRSGIEDERLIIFHSDGSPDFELKVDLPASVVWLTEGGLLVLAGESHITRKILERDFHVSAGSFFQVNDALTGDLVQQTLSFLDPQPQDTIFDLYAGVGLFSAFIAESGAQLVAVEESSWAAEDFTTNLDAFDSIKLYEASVEMALPQIDDRPDKILVDPPRAGLGHDVTDHISRLTPQRIVYISCDPATFARDAKRLIESGYMLEQVIPIDLFPQTFHIETISLFKQTAT
jgi:23S rRNA (uracil1939-C5)-methyltransferase